jgi:rhamnose transport system ATP-binding protein
MLGGLADEGIGVIVISSELPEIMAISDRILIMRRGSVGCILHKEEFSQELIMSKALGTNL